jgi:hypothetical protein
MWENRNRLFRILVFNPMRMYGIPKEKRKITPQAAIKIVEKYGGALSYEEAEIVLDMIYNFANLAFNQQLQLRFEGHRQLIPRPGPGK